MQSTALEWQAVPSSSQPLRQGSILEAIDPQASMWERHLIVITADCDISHNKHRNIVSAIPLLSQEEFHINFAIPKIWQEFLSEHAKLLENTFSQLSGRSPSRERLIEWIQEADSCKEIFETFDQINPLAEDLMNMIQAIAKNPTSSTTVREAVDKLTQAHIAIQRKPNPEKIRKSLSARIKQFYSNPPGDVLFLSSLSPAHQDGYFAYLREPTQIPESMIQLSPGKSIASHRRIGQLQDRYTHSITQRFASVFSSIGLPRDYEEYRNFYAAAYLEELA